MFDHETLVYLNVMHKKTNGSHIYELNGNEKKKNVLFMYIYMFFMCVCLAGLIAIFLCGSRINKIWST